MKITSGVYCIKNLINGKMYIGKSISIEKRWIYHRHLLNNNKHWNSHIQNSWNKNGEGSFSFNVIEECPVEYLEEKEIYYIAFFDTKSNGYNNTDGGEGISNPTNETRERMSNSRKGLKRSKDAIEKTRNANIGRKLSDEAKEKISKANKGNPSSMLGKKHTDESKEKMSKAKKGKKMSNEFKKKISEITKGRPSKKKGIPISEETKEKIRAFWRNKKEKDGGI